MKFDSKDVTVAVLLALPKEVLGAQVVFADAEALSEGLVSELAFNCSICVVPSATMGSPPHTVALVQPPEIGNTNAALCVMQVADTFPNLHSIIVCGIAGGAPTPGNPERDVYLGDIVVSSDDGVLPYDHGHDKRVATFALPSPPPSATLGFWRWVAHALSPPRPDVHNERQYQLDPKLNIYKPATHFLDIVNSLKVAHAGNGAKPPWIARLNERLPKLISRDDAYRRPSGRSDLYAYDILHNGTLTTVQRKPPHGDPRVFYGAIGSANCVLKNPFRRDRLRDEKPKVLAVEMESAGVAEACRKKSLYFTVVRGICDYCDNNKNDHWQHYSAAVAASYAYCVVQRLPQPSLLSVARRAAGKLEPDTTGIARVGMQTAVRGSPSASSTALLTSSQSTAAGFASPSADAVQSPDTLTPAGTAIVVPASDLAAQLAFAAQVQLSMREMRAAVASQDLDKWFELAQATEQALFAATAFISADLRAEALHEIARAYLGQAQLRANAQASAELRQHALKLTRSAMELLK